MPETFRCPSCAAPLEYEGGASQKCPFCEGTVIVPAELFEAAHGRIQIGGALPGMSDTIRQVIELSRTGKKIDAIKLFREKYGVDLRQAKDAAEARERGEAVHIAGNNIRTLNSNDLQTVKKAGYTIGGSILLTTGLILLLTFGFIGAVFYFVFGTMNKAFTRTGDKVKTTAPQDVQELLKIGGDGTGVGKFKDNRVVAVDAGGRIYSGDFSGGRIQVFDASGNFVTQWTVEKGGALRDIAAARNGTVYISNGQNIYAFDGATGRLSKKLSDVRADALAVTAEGTWYVTPTSGYTVFDADLKPVSEQKDAADRANAKFGFDGIAVDGSGTVYLLDQHNGDVCKFSPEGKFLNRFPSGASSGNAIAIDPTGHIFVSDTSEIYVLDPTGKPLRSFPANQAFGIAFNDKGELFVASRPYIVKYKLEF